MADPTPAAPKPAPDPGYIARMIAALKGWNPIKANPQDPNSSEGVGGAARKAVLDKAIADAGG